MKRYLNYLWYVIRHKWFVFQECSALGIPWLGLVHDWSKFLPSEFVPYARHFHNSDGSPRQVKDNTGYCKSADTSDEAFNLAWMLHQKRNKHHWQRWILPSEHEGSIKVLPMPEKYRLEMIADWIGAGRAQNAPDIATWYAKNKDKITLHPATREWIETTLRSLQ